MIPWVPNISNQRQAFKSVYVVCGVCARGGRGRGGGAPSLSTSARYTRRAAEPLIMPSDTFPAKNLHEAWPRFQKHLHAPCQQCRIGICFSLKVRAVPSRRAAQRILFKKQQSKERNEYEKHQHFARASVCPAEASFPRVIQKTISETAIWGPKTVHRSAKHGCGCAFRSFR